MHTFTSPDAPGMTFVRTGEHRPPKKGEWFLSGAIVEAYQAPNDLSAPYWLAIPLRPKLTPNDLADLAKGAGSKYFNDDTLSFFGDTMQNYGVSQRTVYVHTWSGDSHECYELYRKKPVKHGLHAPAYFDVHTFRRVTARNGMPLAGEREAQSS